jgi:pimeloyl-ACP methyl ester carboxylesterase
VDGLDDPAWFRDALAQQAVEEVVVVDGAEVRSRRWGDPQACPVVLVHGNRAHSHWWDHVAPFLARHHSVVALDLTGFGDSGHRTRYSVAQWSRDLLAVTRQVTRASGAPPVVVAHSMGGLVAARAATDAGHEWRGLIAIDATMGQPTLGYRAPRATSRAAAHRPHPTAASAMTKFRPVPGQPTYLPFILRHIARHSIRETPDGWTWKFDPSTGEARGKTLDPVLLRSIACDVAFLRAPNGRVPADAADRLHALFGREVPVIDLPEAHHHVVLDQPMMVVAVLRTFLALWGAYPGRHP